MGTWNLRNNEDPIEGLILRAAYGTEHPYCIVSSTPLLLKKLVRKSWSGSEFRVYWFRVYGLGLLPPRVQEGLNLGSLETKTL